MIIVTPERKKPQSGAHWYTISGLPAHTQPGGKNTTLRHAREQNLMPSVTSIIGQLDKPQLSKWKEDKFITASFDNPPFEGESVQDYKGRIHQIIKDEQTGILDFGTKVHKAIEDVNNGTFDESKDPELFPFVEPFIRWSMSRIRKAKKAEMIVVNPKYGYGGTVDLLCVLRNEARPVTIIDFKTQNVKKGKVNFYESWVYQLAAYSKCFKTVPQGMSLVINSNEPSPCVEKIWSTKEIQAGWRIFQRLCRVWQDVRGYRPLPVEADGTVLRTQYET